ncbi:tetratricopeptide repeat-containing sensor histidine kinase [Lentimicrobium sp. L6]|uniref:tetratricopeptide repeat protein n=1 Tax=Lentimicrobium sp. L6 TaxID=2735916 RepID=UPI001555A446|nr:tetratricopeptide repeat protein [Lentimicrobium sp. L6]NPD86881.1 tetratricopeptide repeat-containing sensor histidine kinase [Lentimicrobium sp. L6]
MNFRYILLVFSFIFFCSISFGQDIVRRQIEIPKNIEIPDYIDELANRCWEIREGHSDSALQLGLDAIELAETYHFPEKQAKANNFVGVVYLHYFYNYRQAIPYFQKAMRTSIFIKDSVQLAYAYNNLGDVFLLNANLPLALQYAELSYKIFRNLKKEEGIAFALINLAEVYRAKKDYEKSLDYFNQAVEIRKAINSSNRMGFVTFNRAKTLEESGNLESARDFYQRSIEYSYESNDFRYVSWSLNGLANIYYKLSEYHQALLYYSKALDWNKERNHEYGYFDNYIGMALVYAQLNDKEKGLELLDEATKVANKLGINTQIINAHHSVLEFYKILDDSENIKLSFDLFISQYDSILDAQQFEIVNELERNFRIQQELLISEQELEYDEKEKSALLLIIVVMVLIMLVILWQYRTNKKMNLRLEAMNQTKDKLFSVISHDLKNPFNTLIGFSDILVSSLEENEYADAHAHAKLIHKASYEGYKQLTNLLQWSLSQSGKIELRPEAVSLSTLLNEIKDFYLIETKQYNIHLEVENNIEELVILDPNIIKIILENLLSNAIKYTPEGGNIIMSTSKESNYIKINVMDSGIGIPTETLIALKKKDRFIKSSKGLRKEKGTGLGLSIVNDLIEIHKANLFVESKDGSGTIFKIEIPTDLKNIS